MSSSSTAARIQDILNAIQSILLRMATLSFKEFSQVDVLQNLQAQL